MATGNHHSTQPRDNLTGEHPAGDAGQILLACLFTATWIADTFIYNYSTGLNTYVLIIIRFPIGSFFALISGYLAISGLNLVFGKHREISGVIDKGAFNLVRHPIYLSEILLYLSCLFFSFSLIAASIWLLTIFFLHYIARYEEKLLLDRFGDQYQNYRQRTPMWIPRFWKQLL